MATRKFYNILDFLFSKFLNEIYRNYICNCNYSVIQGLYQKLFTQPQTINPYHKDHSAFLKLLMFQTFKIFNTEFSKSWLELNFRSRDSFHRISTTITSLANGISPHGSHHNQSYGEARSWAEALEKGEFILGYNTEFITELAKSVLRPAYSTAGNNDGTRTVGWEGKQ